MPAYPVMASADPFQKTTCPSAPSSAMPSGRLFSAASKSSVRSVIHTSPSSTSARRRPTSPPCGPERRLEFVNGSQSAVREQYRLKWNRTSSRAMEKRAKGGGAQTALFSVSTRRCRFHCWRSECCCTELRCELSESKDASKEADRHGRNPCVIHEP